MGKLNLALLGAPLVHHEGREVNFPTRKVLALLVYLAVEGGLHQREQLVDLLWPESDIDAGRATLRSSLARLRDALSGNAQAGAHLIGEHDRVGLNLTVDYESDLQLVETASRLATTPLDSTHPDVRRAALAALQRAAVLCRGQFLHGFSLRDAPEFEAWITLQRQRWEPKMESVLGHLSELHAADAALPRAIEAASRWRALNPLSERAYRRLMELHLAGGERAAAIRTYERCRAILAEELNATPAEETEALMEQIRGTAPRSTSTDEARSQSSVSSPNLVDGPLVGRAAQFEKLAQLYQATRAGQAGVAVVQGESGIGKTRLAQDFLGWAGARGADILRGRAFETGGRLPYQPLVDALRPRIERENAPDDLVSDVWLAELTRLLPELRERYPDLPVPSGDEAAARTRLFEAIVRLAQAIAERTPLVLFIDDAQWADAASLEVLHYIARRFAEDHSSVLLLLSARSEALAMTPALADWFSGLERDADCTRLTLDPLTVDEVRTFVQGLGGTTSGDEEIQALAQWLYLETGGQPFFLIEMLKALLERGALAPRLADTGDWVIELEPAARHAAAWHGLVPPGVRAVIGARLRSISPTAQGLITAAAVLGQGFTFEQLCRVADIPEGDGLSGLEEVVRGRLLREEITGAYLFAHDKIRDVAYVEAGTARRRVFHRRALDMLREGRAPAAELAHHATAADLRELAYEFSSLAGDEAMHLLAARDAIAHYEQAMALAEQLGHRDALPSLWARRGRAFASITRWPEARRDFEAALQGLVGTDRAATLVELAMLCHWLFDVPSTRRYAADALALGEELGRDDLVASAMGALALADSSDGELASSLDRYQRAVVQAGTQRPAELVPAAEMSSLILYWMGNYDEAITRAQEAIELARAVNDTSNLIRAQCDLGLALGASGRYQEALQTLEQARRFGREYGIDTWTARAISMCGGVHLDVFDFDDAETLAEEARELGRSVNFLMPVVSGGIDLLLSFVRRGEVGRTETLIDEVTEAAQNASGAHGWLWRLRLAQARAEIALARADWDAALQWGSDALDQSVARGRRKYEALARAARGHALSKSGRTLEGVVEVRAAVNVARTTGDPALFVRTAAQLLPHGIEEPILAEARAAVEQIANNLPDTCMRERFATAEPVRLLVGPAERIGERLSS